MTRKLTIFFVAMLVTVFAASSAMAYILNARSEEMTANSICDFAGTITLEFAPADSLIIRDYLLANPYVLIRVSLSGTDIPPTADVPLLCKDMRRLSTEVLPAATYPDALGTFLLPNESRLIRLDDPDEVSDVLGVVGTNDITAYVYGVAGQQYFVIYITAMEEVVTVDNKSWIKIGLHDDVEILNPRPDVPGGAVNDGYSTAICADVHDFGGLSKLTVSLDNTPSTLGTTTSDNQIGHFLVEDIELRPCDKTEILNCMTDTEVPLCPIVPGSNQQATCETYQYCMTAEGDWPGGEDVRMFLRVNGAANGDTTQRGVYLSSLVLRREDGTVIDPALYTLTPYEADGVTDPSPTGCAVVGSDVVFTGAKQFMIEIGEVNIAAVLGAGNEVQFCVSYIVNPAEPTLTVGSFVRVWVNAEVLPCGSLFSGMMNMAKIVECGTESSCIYFPYLVSGISPWQAGIVITNVGTVVGPANMEVTFTLYDAAGVKHTYVKNDFSQVVWAGFLDSIVSEFDGGSIPAGASWMHVEANFALDGYSFLTDGNFGAGTLPRNLDHCNMADFK